MGWQQVEEMDGSCPSGQFGERYQLIKWHQVFAEAFYFSRWHIDSHDNVLSNPGYCNRDNFVEKVATRPGWNSPWRKIDWRHWWQRFPWRSWSLPNPNIAWHLGSWTQSGSVSCRTWLSCHKSVRGPWLFQVIQLGPWLLTKQHTCLVHNMTIWYSHEDLILLQISLSKNSCKYFEA